MARTTVDNTDQPDPGRTLLDIGVELKAHASVLGRMADDLSALRKRRPPAQPVFGRTRGTVIIPAGAPDSLIIFDAPSPEQGHFWFVRNIVIGGLTPTTTAAGRADVYVTAMWGSQTTTLAGLGLSDWRDAAGTLPDISFYGAGELILRHNENLAIVISSGTAGQQYVAAASFVDYEESASEQAWSL